ncbi:hypothetical protein B0H13DRAFT_1851408 [Mycena leptocephala]|nr:hypothetical protein B0H13DRAFT_1851408 [Mycena leptocephala]
MTDEVENHSRTLKVVQQDYHELRDPVNELEILNDNLTMERDELTHQIDGMEDTISDLSGMVTAHHVALEKFGALFEEMGGSGDVASTLRSKKAQKALKGPRDNILNTSIRHVFYRAIGYPASVEEQKLAPLDAGGCWIDDPETEGRPSTSPRLFDEVDRQLSLARLDGDFCANSPNFHIPEPF